MNNIDKLCAREVKESIDLSQTNDFPNELEQRHKKIEEYEKLRHELDKRDQTILNIIKEKKDREKKLIFDQKEKSKQEIEEWVKLCDRYTLELKKYNIVCSFCGKYLEKGIANGPCEVNEQFDLDFYFTKRDPPKRFINSKMHYFSEPFEDLEKRLKYAESFWKKKVFENSRRQEIIEEEELNKSRNSEGNTRKSRRTIGRKRSKSCNFGNDRSNEGLENFEKIIGKNWVIKLARTIQSENIDLAEILKKYERANSGTISLKDLESAFMTIDSSLTPEDFEYIAAYFNFREISDINIADFSRNFNSKYLIHLKRSSEIKASEDRYKNEEH